MNYGFTGTREGMAPKQMAALRELLGQRSCPDEFHHGCCVGADEEAVLILRSVWVGNVSVHAHPSDLDGTTSERAFGKSDVCHARRPPLLRNRDIVHASDLLIACPKSEKEVVRSGTWATIRHARRSEIEVVIVTRDGYYIGEGEE